MKTPPLKPIMAFAKKQPTYDQALLFACAEFLEVLDPDNDDMPSRVSKLQKLYAMELREEIIGVLKEQGVL